MGYVQFDLDRDGIAELRLDRPKVNALSRSMLADLADALDRVATLPDVRGVLLTGEGRCFSAGLDLEEVLTLGPMDAGPFLEQFDAVFEGLFRLQKPVAVGVNGHAVAGGLVLALAADFLALPDDPDVRLGLTELAVGVPFPRVAFEIVNTALPPRGYRSLVYGAAITNPRRAFEVGVGDALVRDPAETAREWLRPVVSRPLGTFALAKAHQRGEAWIRIDRHAASERADFVAAITSPANQRSLAGALTRR